MKSNFHIRKAAEADAIAALAQEPETCAVLAEATLAQLPRSEGAYLESETRRFQREYGLPRDAAGQCVLVAAVFYHERERIQRN